MSEMNDWNAQIIAEFRSNDGKVGGPFEGAPVVLMHHVGRKSGAEYVNPVMYLADESDPSTIYVFASKAGAPTHPDWYWNMTEAGSATVEVGTETWRCGRSRATTAIASTRSRSRATRASASTRRRPPASG